MSTLIVFFNSISDTGKPITHVALTWMQLTWETQMYIIKELDEDAYYYLADIPEQHWCRHAFQSTSKSNMLLNNLRESFNNVLKEARDKPIITCMEWIRRYVMKRHFEKMDEEVCDEEPIRVHEA